LNINLGVLEVKLFKVKAKLFHNFLGRSGRNNYCGRNTFPFELNVVEWCNYISHANSKIEFRNYNKILRIRWLLQ